MYGPVLVPKALNAKYVKKTDWSYSLRELIRGVLVRPVERDPGKLYLNHKGYDWRKTRDQLNALFDVEEYRFSPFSSLWWGFNSQWFGVFRKGARNERSGGFVTRGTAGPLEPVLTPSVMSAGRAPCARVDRAILLNCFGRGGSSIAWNMIGSSPDVLMPASEWHHGFYGRWQVVGRLLRRVVRALQTDVPALKPLAGPLYRRACTSVPAAERHVKPRASSIVLKVMDHHIAMNPTIAASFPSVSQVVLVRHPLAQCESLLRHGLAVEQATAWYVDVMRQMIRLAETPGTIVCHFDSLVRDPFAERDVLYDKLGLSRPEPDGFRLKRKKFGAERTTEVRGAAGEYVDVTAGNVAGLIDKDVNARSIDRLSDADRNRVWQATGEVASYFGYTSQAATAE